MQTHLIDPILLQDFFKVLELLKYMAEACLTVVIILYCCAATGFLFCTIKRWFNKK
jgi:hypothetical protein